MINLLPEQHKKKIASMYHVELSGAWCMQFVIVLVVGCAMFLPSIVAIKSGEIARENTIAIRTTEIAALEKDTTVDATIQRVDARLKRLGIEDPSEARIYERIVDVASRKREGVSVASFAVSKSGSSTQMQITGTATTRDVLLGFVRALEESQLFTRVQSPLSNLVKDRDLTFAITLYE